MIIKGNRRGGAKQLADHILRRDTNEDVIIKSIIGFPTKLPNALSLRNTLNLMAAQGQAKGKLRTLYHAILAPQAGETLNVEQLTHAVDTLAKNLGMEDHQRIIVEHRKSGRQHFHVVFNILHPQTGKQARLQWTKKIEWKTSRQLEAELGLKPVIVKGRPARRWEAERGKRSGIDPLQVRKTVTAIYQASKTGQEFVSNLEQAGFVLTKGEKGSYVLVDNTGDIHGLMRRIEGAKVKDLRRKFPDLKDIPLPPLSRVLAQKRPAKPSKTSRFIKGAAEILKRVRSGFKNPRFISSATQEFMRFMRMAAALVFSRKKTQTKIASEPAKNNMPPAQVGQEELLQWAFENGRLDFLTQLGINVPPDYFDL